MADTNVTQLLLLLYQLELLEKLFLEYELFGINKDDSLEKYDFHEFSILPGSTIPKVRGQRQYRNHLKCQKQPKLS